MGRKSTWPSDQEEFLNSYVEEYLKIHKSNKVYEPFWVKVRREYNVRFPTLETFFPGREEKDLTDEELEQYGKHKLTTHNCILVFYRWKASKTKKLLDIKKLEGATQKTRKRLYKPAEIYSKMFFKKRLKSLYEVEKIAQGLSNRKALGVKTRIARDEFAKEDPETVKKVLERMEKENNKLLGVRPANPGPGDYQRAINEIPGYLRSALGPLAKSTGYSFTVLMGGPTPAKDGKVCTASFHELADGVKLTFAESKTDYDACVVKPFSKYLKDEYDPATCKNRALTKEEVLEIEESDRWSSSDEDDDEDSDDDSDDDNDDADRNEIGKGASSKGTRPKQPTRPAKGAQDGLLPLDPKFLKEQSIDLDTGCSRPPPPPPPPPPPSSPPPPSPPTSSPQDAPAFSSGLSSSSELAAAHTASQSNSDLAQPHQQRPKPKQKNSAPTCRDIITSVISAPPSISTTASSVEPSSHPSNSPGSIAITNGVVIDATHNAQGQPDFDGNSSPSGVLLPSRTANTFNEVQIPAQEVTYLNFNGLPDDAFASPSKFQHNNQTNHKTDDLGSTFDHFQFTFDPTSQNSSLGNGLENISFSNSLDTLSLGFNGMGTGIYSQNSFPNTQFNFGDSALTNTNGGMDILAANAQSQHVPSVGSTTPISQTTTELPVHVSSTQILPIPQANLPPDSTMAPADITPPADTTPPAIDPATLTNMTPPDENPTVTSPAKDTGVGDIGDANAMLPAVTATLSTTPDANTAPSGNEIPITAPPPPTNVTAMGVPIPEPATTPPVTTNNAADTDTIPPQNAEDRPKRTKKASTRNEKMDMIGTTPPAVRLPSPDPEDVSEWAIVTKEFLVIQPLGDSWMGVVTAWYDLEEILGYGSMSGAKTGLPAASRPSEWAKWTSRCRVGAGRNLQRPPAVQDPAEIGLAITKWWNSLQPSFRQTESGLPLPSLDPPSDAKDPWASLCRAGPNGLVAVILLLAWWGLALPSRSRFQEDSSQLWEGMVADVTKVLLIMKDSATHLASTKKRKRGNDGANMVAKKARPDGSSASTVSTST